EECEQVGGGLVVAAVVGGDETEEVFAAGGGRERHHAPEGDEAGVRGDRGIGGDVAVEGRPIGGGEAGGAGAAVFGGAGFPEDDLVFERVGGAKDGLARAGGEADRVVEKRDAVHGRVGLVGGSEPGGAAVGG